MGKISLIQRVRDYILCHHMVTPGDKVLVAVSGGPDSIALLHLLYLLKNELGISLHVAHLNHMFRGEESEADAVFVAERARHYSLPVTVESFDVKLYRRRRRLSKQAAAREVRYRFFLSCAAQVGASRVALAHHGDDQAETMMINFLRGTGMGGLKGILPVREGFYIRPFLQIRRAEIENFCSEMDLAFRQDASNLKPIYTRNKIRLKLMPLMEKEYNPELIPALLRLSEICRAEDAYLDQLTTKAFQEVLLAVDKGHISLCLEGLAQTPLALLRRILRQAWQFASGSTGGLDFQHVEGALSLITGGTTGAQIDMPGHVVAVRTYTSLEIKKTSGKKGVPGYVYKLRVPGSTYIPEIDISVDAWLGYPGEEGDPRKLPKSEALLDLDKLPSEIFVRRRLAGDIFQPYGQTSALKLKDFLIKQKIPRAHRDRIPLICTPEEIVWVGGVRSGERWKIGGKTKRMLHLKVSPGKSSFSL